MRILCYGSLNIDMVFKVPHFVEAGETLSSSSMTRSAGGKGANQAAALAKAGCETYMAGKVGRDGRFLVDILEGFSVDCANVLVTDNPSGQAIIQLSDSNQNAIILLPGENRNIAREEIDSVLAKFSAGDWIVLQNEINLIGYNEIEGAGLAGCKGSYEEIIGKLSELYPEQEIIMTAGSKGAYYRGREGFIYQPIIDYPVVDTTAAGDTFIGYYLASCIRGLSVKESLYYASKASGIAVSRPGAMQSVPVKDEIFTEEV